MVRIDRVHTGAGDGGTTRLADGSEVGKDDPRIQAIGAVDAANAAIGVALLHAATLPAELAAALAATQHRLFDLGADLATPPGGPYEERIPRIAERAVAELEEALEQAGAELSPLTSFVLPGGSAAAAHLHQARCAVRQAEANVVAAWPAFDRGPIAGQPLLRYLNRLSDLCFQLARVANDGGRGDVLWEPGQ